MGLSYRQLGLQAAALRSSPHLGNEGSSLSLRASNGTSDSDTRHLPIGSATLDDEWQESSQDFEDWDLENWGWPLFRRERAKFLSLFRWERGEISRKFRNFVEISKFR